MAETKKGIKIAKLPFAWRLYDPKNDLPSPVPLFLPFEFTFDQANQLIKQRLSNKTRVSLKEIYNTEFNMGNIVSGHCLGERYAKDFIDFFLPTLKKDKVKSLLEVGCGEGIVLEKLAKMGFDVMGIDPYAGNLKSIKIIKDYFPSKLIFQKFDVLFHIDVLEHVDNPVKFLKKHLRFLNPEGAVIIATPDCTRNIKNGDISIAYHEHLSYFDVQSLKNVLHASGFEVLAIQKSKFGNSLYAVAKRSKKKLGSIIKPKTNSFESFIKKSNILTSEFKKKVEQILSSGHSVGFYVPIRALAYLAQLDLLAKVRLFDDNPINHGKYYEGIKTKIEDFADLKKNPTDIIFVMSLPFGEIIEKKINQNLPQIKTYKLSDFFKYDKD